ncbi:hypothetical protein JHK86_009759 [Glycine max]|nr:hypothetical protein JHK86_009759 [Glycine max]
MLSLANPPSSLPLSLTPHAQSRKATLRSSPRSGCVCYDAHRRVLVSFLASEKFMSSLPLSLNDVRCFPCSHFIGTKALFALLCTRNHRPKESILANPMIRIPSGSRVNQFGVPALHMRRNVGLRVRSMVEIVDHNTNFKQPSKPATPVTPPPSVELKPQPVFAPSPKDYVNGFPWPPRSYTCSFCRKEFKSAQALGGHMNVHRRDRPRLRQSSPSIHEVQGQAAGPIRHNLNLDPNNNSASS